VNDLWTFWIKARDGAAIVAGARLQDPHRSHASHAVINGEALYVTRPLPEHRGANTANRYAHLDDATLSEATERVALVIQGSLHPLSHRAAKRNL